MKCLDEMYTVTVKKCSEEILFVNVFTKNIDFASV